MDRITVTGGKPLKGQIPISGAKNAALPLMIASLLTADRLTLKNVPNLADVNLLARILRNHVLDHTIDGKRADPSPHMGETFHLSARDIVDTTAPYELASRMRASFWVLGPLTRPPRRRGASAAGRLRHRHAPGRPAPDGLKELGAEIDITAATSSPRHRTASRGDASPSPRSRSALPTTC
jgi:UDP-N-acetylglucosamine 1-carboxyvinyltransferase